MASAVTSDSYYSFCGSLLVAAAHSTRLDEEHQALLRQQAIEVYNLRPRSSQTTVVMSKQDDSRAVSAIAATAAEPSAKRSRPKSTSRSRTAFNKRLQVNARERERMKILNTGFENLRNTLPCYIADGHISKITTLRLAINYIKTLTEVLKDTKIADERSREEYSHHGSHLELRPGSERSLVYAYNNAGGLKMDYGLSFNGVASNALPGSDLHSAAAHRAYLEIESCVAGTLNDGEYSQRV